METTSYIGIMEKWKVLGHIGGYLLEKKCLVQQIFLMKVACDELLGDSCVRSCNRSDGSTSATGVQMRGGENERIPLPTQVQSYLGELPDARAKSFGQLFVLNLQYLIMHKTPPHEQPYFSPAWFFPGLYRCGFRWMLRVHRNHLFVLRRWHSKSNYYRSAYTARFAGGRASCRKPASKLAYRIPCKGAAIARSALCRLRRTQQRRATL